MAPVWSVPECLSDQGSHLTFRHPGQSVQRPSFHEKHPGDPPGGVIELALEARGTGPVHQPGEPLRVPLIQVTSQTIQDGPVLSLGGNKPGLGTKEVLVCPPARLGLLLDPKSQAPEEEVLSQRKVIIGRPAGETGVDGAGKEVDENGSKILRKPLRREEDAVLSAPTPEGRVVVEGSHVHDDSKVESAVQPEKTGYLMEHGLGLRPDSVICPPDAVEASPVATPGLPEPLRLPGPVPVPCQKPSHIPEVLLPHLLQEILEAVGFECLIRSGSRVPHLPLEFLDLLEPGHEARHQIRHDDPGIPRGRCHCPQREGAEGQEDPCEERDEERLHGFRERCTGGGTVAGPHRDMVILPMNPFLSTPNLRSVVSSESQNPMPSPSHSAPGPEAARHVRWEDLPWEPVTDTIRRRIVTGDDMMIAHVFLDAGAVVPKHSHHNEQITYIVSGALHFRLGENLDREVTVRAGEVLHIPAHLPHEARALEDTLDVDIFSPPRADWLDGSDSYFRETDG